MKRKDNCAECGHVHTAVKLHRSMQDHKMLCYKCYGRENNNRKDLKLKILRDYDKELTNPMEKKKKFNILGKLFKFRGNLLNNDEKVKRYEEVMK